MKKDISTLMSEQDFWKIVEQAKPNGSSEITQDEALTDTLKALTQDEIAGYYYWKIKFDRLAYRSDLWCVAYVVMGGSGDDAFMDFRHWLYLQGETVYKTALENPDSLCDVFDGIADGDIPLIEAYEEMTAFESKFECDFEECLVKNYTEVDYNLPDIKLLWGENNEGSMKEICPNTFKKWWNNDRF